MKKKKKKRIKAEVLGYQKRKACNTKFSKKYRQRNAMLSIKGLVRNHGNGGGGGGGGRGKGEGGSFSSEWFRYVE